MSLYWILPRFRLPAAVDVAIDDVIHWLSTTVSTPIRNTSFEYWLLYRDGRTKAFFVVVLVMALTGIVALHISSPRRLVPSDSVMRSPADQQQVVADEGVETVITILPDKVDEDKSPESGYSPPFQVEQGTPSPSAATSSLTKNLASQDHGLLEAGHAGPPFRSSTPKNYKTPAPLFEPAPAQTPRTPPTRGLRQAMLTKLQTAKSSSRSVETPIPSSSAGDVLATPIGENGSAAPSPDDGYRAWLMGTNFSHIKSKWPTNFEISVESGDLLEDGTPTKKFVDRMVSKRSSAEPEDRAA